MIQSLFYKEWIKTRRVIFLFLILFSGFVAYSFIDVAQMFRMSRPEIVWNDIILNDVSLVSYFNWLPLLAGIILALTQHVPEMINKRFKLTLHLPLPENKIVVLMLSYGLAILVMLYAATCIVLVTGLSYYFPSEFIRSSLYVASPWFLGGFAAYTLTSWVVYEPVWKFRVVNMLIAVCVLQLFLFDGRSGAYLPFIPYLVVIAVMTISFPFYSIIRFKEGAQ